jgi:ATP-binding cassette, subfamily B, bacterial MsbA
VSRDSSTADVAAWPIYKRLLGYTRPYWPMAALALLAMAVDAGCATLFTRLIKPMLDGLFTVRDPFIIFWMPFWIVGLFLLRGFATFTENYGMAYIGRHVVQQLRVEVFGTYLKMDSAFFASEPSGHQIARITYTSDQVAQASTEAVRLAVTDSLTVIGMVALMLYTSAYLTLALFVLVPVVGGLVTVVSRRFRRINRSVQNSMGSITGVVEEAVNGQREVKIYGGQQREQSRFFDIATLARRLNIKISATSAVSSSVVQIVAAIALALIVFMATRPGEISKLTPGDFMTMIIAMGMILPPLKRMGSVQSHIQRGVAAASDLFEILDREPEADRGNVDIQRCTGDIVFDGVEMVYPNAKQSALRGIDLRCAAGSVTALVGRSGSGKSTLVSLLPRFYEPSAGRVTLDGLPLTDYTLTSLRRQIAWVGQHVVLFDDTVAGNIAYGELAGASREQIVEAARAANAMEFIDKLPQGLDTPIGERGGSLSGGQRQRIAIARAVLKNAPILVLDEATSALDTESERLIQQALERLMRDRTTLVIAHRLSTIEHADQIAVLEQGRVVELGTHTELIERQGQYAALHRMQFHDAPVAEAQPD